MEGNLYTKTEECLPVANSRNKEEEGTDVLVVDFASEAF